MVAERRPADVLEHPLRIEPAEPLDQIGDETGPSGLVARADTGAGVAVEVLVEEDQIAPVRVGLERGGFAVHRPGALLVAEEDANEAPRDLLGHLEERHADTGSGRTLDR